MLGGSPIFHRRAAFPNCIILGQPRGPTYKQSGVPGRGAKLGDSLEFIHVHWFELATCAC